MSALWERIERVADGYLILFFDSNWRLVKVRLISESVAYLYGVDGS